MLTSLVSRTDPGLNLQTQRSVYPLSMSALSSQYYWSTGGYATKTMMLTIPTLTLIFHYFYTNHTQFAKTYHT